MARLVLRGPSILIRLPAETIRALTGSDLCATPHPDAGDADHDAEENDQRQRRIGGAGRRAAGVQRVLVARGRGGGHAGRTGGSGTRRARTTAATTGGGTTRGPPTAPTRITGHHRGGA